MIQMQSISKTFGLKQVLSNFTFSFAEGITALAGINGCGKTTLLKILTGIQAADSGSIVFNDKTIAPKHVAWRQHIGYLPQSLDLYSRMQVYQFLDYMLLLSNVASANDRKKKIVHHAELFNVSHCLQIPCGELSGGMKQRVGIVQAVIHDPSIILLDEPANNLDVEERERFHEYLRTIRTGRIILYIGHILDELFAVSDCIAIMRNGGVAFGGTRDELLREIDKRGKQPDSLHKEIPAQNNQSMPPQRPASDVSPSAQSAEFSKYHAAYKLFALGL